VSDQAEAVRDGIAVIDSYGVAAMLPSHVSKTLGGAVERVVPGCLMPARALADERCANAIGIVVDIRDGRRFWTDVPAAERIVGVTADRADSFAVEIDQDAACRFTERTCRDPHAGSL